MFTYTGVGCPVEGRSCSTIELMRRGPVSRINSLDRTVPLDRVRRCERSYAHATLCTCTTLRVGFATGHKLSLTPRYWNHIAALRRRMSAKFWNVNTRTYLALPPAATIRASTLKCLKLTRVCQSLDFENYSLHFPRPKRQLSVLVSKLTWDTLLVISCNDWFHKAFTRF